MSRTQELFLRILSAVIFVPLLLYALFVKHHVYFPIIPLLAGGWALFEFYELMTQAGYQPFRTVGFSLFIFFLVVCNLTISLDQFFPFILWTVLLSGFLVYLLTSPRSTTSFFANSGITMLGLLYIAWPFSLLINMLHEESGAWYIVWLILVTWICDIGAYLIGSAIGKHKLCPSISPGKTVEGLIGGIAASILVAFIYWKIVGEKYHYIHFSLLTNLWFALLIAVVGVVGDLVESVLKRQAGVKDSGNTFTGHGGMLDIIDSLLFTVPVFYYVNQLLV